MWPPKLRDHQADGHDVEQNETTSWLQHTEWPRLFHNRPLGIIAATARKPKPAWYEDYLLGQWHDTALRSPAVVEAQLRVILRGIDIMVDRASFTLAKTSYRSRCWLNTYWKDTFWPHEFKAVNCLKRYVDAWRRFICYVFRVQHFETHPQQDIYNLRFGRDETAMMRHILYLVALLQREAESSNWSLDEGREGNEDEPSDDEDEDEYIREYDRVETENHCNENGKYNDMSDEDELSPYQEPTGDMSASIIIQYAAVLRIQGSSLAFHLAHSSSPRLAALIWIGRLLFLEYAVPVYAYKTLDTVWPSRTAYPSQPDRISSIRCKYLLWGCYTPFGELTKLKAFAKSIMKREGIPGNLTWAPDSQSFTIGDDKKVLLSESCETHHRIVTTVQEQVDEMLLGWQPDIDVSSVRDDLTCRKAGWSFIDKTENNLADIWETLLHSLQKSSFRGRFHKIRTLECRDLSQVSKCWYRAQQIRCRSNSLQSESAWPGYRGN
ncbi:hypothetical protein FOYG_17324 [Fusarium oxysporum NRRL 32931]|uniref:Uncharacterized protein n=1 Tax=Fusarium oxysporum NRRL 32931 TaxID=660029 RepID=W9HBB3_FUSOX|nr:hypothetical protein FOYG_17324 [Fusarium oxysporum NRRL 32931]